MNEVLTYFSSFVKFFLEEIFHTIAIFHLILVFFYRRAIFNKIIYFYFVKPNLSKIKTNSSCKKITSI